MRTKARTTPQTDPGLQQIDAWHAWFLDAHTARLKAANLTPHELERETAAIEASASAIVAKMRSDYLSRYRP